MRSIGINLEPAARRGLLNFQASRPNMYGLEMHLLGIQEVVRKIDPQLVVVDPITNLVAVGDNLEVRSMLTRLIDFFKNRQITTLFTSLSEPGEDLETSQVGISSLIDTWIVLRNIEHGGERNRGLHVLKSRGMAHSNQVREFQLSDRGIDLVDVFVRGGDVLVGAARVAQRAQQAAEAQQRREEIERLRRAIERRRRTAATKAMSFREEAESEVEELQQRIAQENARLNQLADQHAAVMRERMAAHDGSPNRETGSLSSRTRKRTQAKGATRRARARRVKP
jgi:circadian clock protein KaiC